MKSSLRITKKSVVMACLGFAQLVTSFSFAGEVAFSIKAEPAVHTIDKCVMLWGNGWVKPVADHGNDRLHWTGRSQVNSYCGTPTGFRFVPASNGLAVLHMGIAPSSLAGTGKGLLVEDLKCDGAGIVNRKSDWIVRMTGGVPVVVRFTARLAVSSDDPGMGRIFSRDTPAHKAMRFFQHGMNLGNYLEAPPDSDWGVSYDASDYDAIKSEGFDHVRVPCAWHYHSGPGPDFTISPEFFAEVSSVVTQATARGLSVIINWHHFDAFTDSPSSHIDQLVKGWEQIASHYASFSGRIAFELLNEPKDSADAVVMNDAYARIIPAIRARAPDNTLFVGPAEWNRARELEKLRLPASESNIVVTIHDYSPFLFTHQGASWTGPPTATTNVVFPGPPSSPIVPAMSYDGDDSWVRRWFEAYNLLPSEWNPCGVLASGQELRLARAWSVYYGRPVHVGEWGCIVSADAETRQRYYAVKHRLLSEVNLGWAVWDWKAQFRYWDPEKQAPMPGLRQALFPD